MFLHQTFNIAKFLTTLRSRIEPAEKERKKKREKKTKHQLPSCPSIHIRSLILRESTRDRSATSLTFRLEKQKRIKNEDSFRIERVKDHSCASVVINEAAASWVYPNISNVTDTQNKSTTNRNTLVDLTEPVDPFSPPFLSPSNKLFRSRKASDAISKR